MAALAEKERLEKERNTPKHSPLPNLIGICGTKGSGKSTLAQQLFEYGPAWLNYHTAMRLGFDSRMKIPKQTYSLKPFAGPLKAMLATLPIHKDYIYGDDDKKRQIVPIFNGKTARHAMQTLGTEWGRNCIGDNFWVDLWDIMNACELSKGANYIIDDIRFENEADYVRYNGGVVVQVIRSDSSAAADNHASEVMDFEPDIIIENVDKEKLLEQLQRKWNELQHTSRHG